MDERQMGENMNPENNASGGNITAVEISSEVKKSFIDYAMSVIVDRALPDVRDGLKPVHRRILYAMHTDGLTYNKPFRKSATTVGNVLGHYHPHGDAAVYNAMVRLAQPFSLRYPLVEGQGNFGNIDGDGAAAYRYTGYCFGEYATTGSEHTAFLVYSVLWSGIVFKCKNVFDQL